LRIDASIQQIRRDLKPQGAPSSAAGAPREHLAQPNVRDDIGAVFDDAQRLLTQWARRAGRSTFDE